MLIRNARQRGFTLVEMMVVVIIVGALATLATYAVRKYIFSAKTSEAVSMMTIIKAAEEAYKDETFVYLDVSGSFTDSSKYYPMTDPGRKKVMWGGTTGVDPDVASRWRALGVQTDSPVQFAYAAVAWQSGGSVPTLPTDKTFAFTSTEPSYAVVAKGDVDGDGSYQYVVGHSFNAEIYVENEGE